MTRYENRASPGQIKHESKIHMKDTSTTSTGSVLQTAWSTRPSADRLLEFKTIVDCESITQVAKQLQQTRPTLSRHLRELEEQLGVRLLQRTTRQLHLTAAGKELYQSASRIASDIDTAWNSVRYFNSEPCGPLRVGVPEDELAADPFFLQFATEFPKVNLEVNVVGHNVNIRASGIDVALQFGTIQDPDLIVKRLFTSRRIAMATRTFLDTVGRPSTPKQLTHYRCIVYRDAEGLLETQWPLTSGSYIEVQPWLVTNSFRLMLQAVHAGLGIGLIPENEREKNPDLIEIFPDQIQQLESLHIIYVERELQLPHIRLFIERASKHWKQWIENW